MSSIDNMDNTVNNKDSNVSGNNKNNNIDKNEINGFDEENKNTLGVELYEKQIAMLDPTTIYHAHIVKSLIYRTIFICIIVSFLVSFIIYCILFNIPPLEFFEFFFIWLEMKKNNKNEMFIFLHFLDNKNKRDLSKNNFNKDT